ncbi:MAG TPA: 2-C-methyl-D-erythritol 4-phosphate cytidylyltransferase [Puia sp.]|nr:2-C-methyl-D-erythritol 4-phosphate cytidylyltransferase [Puia sp.]
MKKFAIIAAAGSGLRMGTELPKQFMLILGKPLLWYSVKAFQDAFEDMEIILVLPQAYMETGRNIAELSRFPQQIRLVTGGETRFESVKYGLKHVEHPSIVFVHDGARCLVSPGLIQRCYASALERGNAIPSVTSTDSIRIDLDGENQIVDRRNVKIIQTPQTFGSHILQTAFEQDYDESFTDEASVVEKSGLKINLIEGEASNIKITFPADLIIAEKLIGQNSLNA